MTYVMADLHGEYDKYIKMLEEIDFSEVDDMYVLGDIVDRGPDPVKLLTDMSMRVNVYPILGNHDFMALHVLRKLCVEITDSNYATQIDADTLKALSIWQKEGGNTTLEAFRELEPEDREALLEYIEEFVPYEEVEINGKSFLLVHGGVPYEKRDIPMEKQDISELITERPDYEVRYFADKYMVTGHTPTASINPFYAGRIYSANGHIAIDCGACFGMKLGCLRLDDMAEFYVDQ